MRLFMITLIAIAVSGCVTTQERRAQKARFYSTIPTCESEKECEYKWSAARRWVLDNAGMKLQHVEDDFLETYNSGRNSTSLAVRVVKEPYRDGYRLVVTTGCRNIFGCYPDAQGAALDFNRTVNSVYIPSNKKADTETDKSQARDFGKQSISAEKVAKRSGCVSSDGTRAVGDMIIEDAGVETYQFHCADTTLLIRCEFSECREL